jgi:hypothetical protein
MKRNFVVLFVAVNVLVVVCGGFLAYSDLYIREYSIRTHSDTAVIDVEYSLLVYRPTYEYYQDSGGALTYVVSVGSWTLDFFQLSIVVAVVASLLWFLSTTRTKTANEQTYSW